MFSIIWRALDIAASMTTSYIYLWFAVFGVNEEEPEFHLWFMYSSEVFFFFCMYTKFMTDYISDGETEPEKSIKNIVNRYLHGDFLIDFIAWVPMAIIFEHEFWFIFKTLRIINGVKIFNVGVILSNLKARA